MRTRNVPSWRPAGWPRPVRRVAVAIAAVVVLAAVTLTMYRMLRPADNLTTASKPLPSAAPTAAYAELASAPLIIDRSVRVYAESRRVWADTPVSAFREMTPHWAYRRWPAEVVGVIAMEHQYVWGRPSLVITKWSDGEVVALDALTGAVTWQVRVEPSPADTFSGRRTGAQTVYQPTGIFTATGPDGRKVLLVPGRDQVRAYDPWTGVERWHRIFPAQPGCHDVDWTGESTYVVKDSCATPAVLSIFDASTGAPLGTWRPPGASAGPGKEANWHVEPTACAQGLSGCRLMKVAATAEVTTFARAAQGYGGITPAVWRLGLQGQIAPEPAGSSDTMQVVGDVLVQQMLNGFVWAYSRSTGERLWTSDVGGSLVAADDASVYLVSREFALLVLDIKTGTVQSQTRLRARADEQWTFQNAYLHDGFVVIERLRVGAKETEPDDQYYLSGMPVLLVDV
ncbi:MAG TPA: PQQ-binding-like beta-propeller repeat protein [Micromonosporaceae bacterium]|nr:PQQ-binding-like beta-propeller repeat protein [Micromonosporaceae bacterium]